MFQIEKGIRIPEHPRGRPKGGVAQKYPLRRMEPGDRFLVPMGNPFYLGRMITAAQRRLGLRFCYRIVPGGVRVWRTA